MPTIATHNLQLNPRSLQDISGLDPTWFPEAMSWAGRANQMDTTTLEDAMRAAAHEKAMDPLRLSKQQADIDQTIASTGLTKANTAKQDMENEVYGANKAGRIASEGRKLLAEASDSDLKILENQVYTALQSKDPKERQVAQAIVPHLKFAVQERLKTNEQLRVQGSANAAAMALQKQRQSFELDLENKRIDAGKHRDKAGSVKTLETSIATAKTAAQRHQMLIDAAKIAELEGNGPLAESYRARAEEIRPQAEAELRMLQKPGEIDLSKSRTPGQPLPVTPQGSIAPKSKLSDDDLINKYLPK